jgi:2,3-bisphosphoglycerate-dependent phosphoglycerate mutase
VGIAVVFETHATSEHNEQGRASGWLPSRLSALGREQAQQLGARRAGDGLAAVFSSDLTRAAETAAIAFAGTPIPVLLDWRLRECDYGQHNSSAAAELEAGRPEHLDHPYPGGESWRQAVTRVSRFLADLPLRWSGQRVLIIGHVATRWALEHVIDGIPLEHLVAAPFSWRPGWEYLLLEDPHGSA